VATSAAIALGRLGSTASAEALLAAYPRAAAPLQAEFANALLQVADQLAQAGELDEAAAIFAWFDTPNATEHQRFAALRGAVITRRREAADRLLAAITSDDSPAARYAISLVPLVPGRSATEAFVAVWEDLPIEHQVLLLQALGDRGDASASPALVAAIAREEPEIRQAALAALGNLGDASAVSTLLRASAEAEGEEQKVARAAVRQLTHPEVDTELVRAMGLADTGPRVEAIRALAARRASVAPDTLLTAVRDPEPTVRLAAWEALGTLAGEPQLAALVDLAVAAGEGDDQAAAREAIDRVLFRCADRQRGTEVILANLSTAPRADHPVLLRLLATVGTPAGLVRLRTALRDPDAAVSDAAARALASWPRAEAGDDLLALMDQTRNESWRELALQGYLRLAAAADDPAAMYLAALQRVRRVDDRKAVLDGLGRSSNSLEALNLTLQYLEEESLRTTAGIAAIRIAFRLRQQHEQAARDALARVLATVPHPDVQQRARDVIVEMDKYEDHILHWVTVGPFQEDGQEGAALYASVFEPEKDPDGVDWQPLTEGIGSWEINLEATYGPLDLCAAYLRTRLWSPKDQAAQLELGSDDGVKAWLNGELLLDQWREGGAEPRQQLVPVELKQGWNDLMLKVVDQRGGWVAAARVRRPDGSALEGLKIEGR
jgi:HEAT repeat protein